MTHPPAFLNIVEEARKTVNEVTIDQVLERQKNGEHMHFVDVREDDEFRAGHAAGAVHIGKGVIERDIERKIPEKDAPIVLYCGGGFRSALAAESLKKMGYTHVDSMAGGYQAWCEKDLPTER
jgi:rhodanese-related sulfurtransferase